MRAVFTLLLLIAAPLAAHPLKLSETTISANPRSGQLEVAHSLSLHDMADMLRGIGAAHTDVIGDSRARAAIESYVADHFHMAIGGQRIALTLIGSEIEGGNLWVYQESAVSGGKEGAFPGGKDGTFPGAEEGTFPGAGTLSVRSSLLLDIFEGQRNRVNIDLNGRIRTLVFTSDTPQTLSLP